MPRILTRRPAPQNWATTTAPLPNTHTRRACTLSPRPITHVLTRIQD